MTGHGFLRFPNWGNMVPTVVGRVKLELPVAASFPPFFVRKHNVFLPIGAACRFAGRAMSVSTSCLTNSTVSSDAEEKNGDPYE